MTREEETLRKVLKERGLRYSKPREAILLYFAERDKHVSAENLYLELKQRGAGLSLSTVYLNLGVLRDAGLIREFGGMNGEAVYDSNLSPHNHVICRVCGVVLDVPLVTIGGTSPAAFLREHAERHSGWSVEEPDLNLQGICPCCRG